MTNRHRTDPNRSAQQEIFRGAGETRGNQLGARGGTRGTDIGTTRSPLAESDDRTDEPHKPDRKHR